MNDFWESFRLANSYTIPMQWVPSLPWPLPRTCPASFLWYCSKPAHFPLIYQVAPFCPACHFGILVFPDLLLKDGAIYLSLDNIPLLTTLFIAPIVIRAKSLGAATICGGTVYYILQEWL
ncbi:AzlD domain-containing protein [Acidaminococcus intestini]|nr:AzlD domain-containing protein [Acidaminococcus intestini]